MTKTLVDTNVLVYALNKREKQKHLTCANILIELIDSGDMVVSIQNLVELSRVLSEKAVPSIDNEMVRQHVFDLSESSSVISYDENTIMYALMVSKQHRIHFFDALLAVTMQENGISRILTENTKDFKRIQWMDVANPFE